MTVETSGVSEKDSISALSFKSPLMPETCVLHTPLSPELVPTCLRFLGETAEQYNAQVKISTDVIRDLLVNLSRDAGLPIIPLTYNVDFQQRFLDRILPRNDATLAAAMLPALDLTRLAWSIQNAGAWFLSRCASLEELRVRIEGTSTKQKGTGYKQVLPAWGILLPTPLLPAMKPVLLEQLLMKVMGVGTPIELCDIFRLQSDGLFQQFLRNLQALVARGAFML